jgi:hypothetical protein
VRLPARISKNQLGTLTRHADVFQFKPARDVMATIDGRPVGGATQLSTTRDSRSLHIGNLRLSVHAVGEDFYLLVADAQNQWGYAARLQQDLQPVLFDQYVRDVSDSSARKSPGLSSHGRRNLQRTRMSSKLIRQPNLAVPSHCPNRES